MVYGIGVDCVSIQRIEKSIQRDHFIKRVFSPLEQQQIKRFSGNRSAEYAAGCFAAKEAFLKAVGTGLGGFALAEIGTQRQPGGAPCFEFSGCAAEFCSQARLQAHLSITHENGVAAAFVVLEQQKP